MSNTDYPQWWTPDAKQQPDAARLVRTACGEPITFNADHTITTPTDYSRGPNDYPREWT
ncbi:hypothetical protein [Gordonia sp. CPCC 205333]|uniref:hypothetical protein n=1 Tax=Gordonia sp. CPCC 205333 TaxID=3140790 RepID=UPI003AF3487A